MEITHEYDSETQKLIDKIEENIISIKKQYEAKFYPETATECLKASINEEVLMKEYREAIKPYQKMLEEIYLKSNPKIIIKNYKN